MTQALPDLPVHGVLDISGSNHAQQRGAHGLFRYFGKLAPDVTAAVLDDAARLLGARVRIDVVDVMCGSGTTLIEACDRGWSARGFDVNPVAVLYAEVKTRRCDPEGVVSLLEELARDPWTPSPEEVTSVFAKTRNGERWFSSATRAEVARLRLLLDTVAVGAERDVLLAALLGRLRAYSNASVRTGRIFYDPESAIADIMSDYRRSVLSIVERLPRAGSACSVELGDARHTGLEDASADLVFCHPPYFGLYRYSSDVLRFELEVGGWSRGEVAKREIAEGWKSGDVGLLDNHVADMTGIMCEARRLLRPSGVFALVASNSTLGDVQLPVIDRLAAAADAVGLTLERHVVRRARNGSASYHRSARTDKVIQQDHILLFRA